MRYKNCDEPTCKKLIIFLTNRQTGKIVPVDYESLTEDEKNFVRMIKEKGIDAELMYNKQHHIKIVFNFTLQDMYESQ